MNSLRINAPDLCVRLLVNELVPNRYAQRIHRLAEQSKLDILEPAVGSVVLQADITRARVFTVGNIEFVGSAIGSLIGLGKLIQIDVVYLLSVERHVDDATGTSDLDVVPFTDGFHGVLRWLG